MQRSARLGRVAALAGLLASTLALGASAADAGSIYACVNKHKGSARFVGAKTKCRRTERRVTWNTTGPVGPSGTTGAPGAPGANGVGASYSSFSLGPLTLAPSAAGDIVVSKTIPPGSYFVSGKTVVAGTEATSAVFVVVACELVDTTGTPAFKEPTEAVDVSEWAQQLSQNGAEWEALSTLHLQGQLTTTVPTTVALVCDPLVGTKEAKVEALASQISALQTTANR